MVFFRQLSTFSIALLLFFTSYSKADTLMDALNLAYSGNPSLQAARAQLKSVDKNIALAWAGALPQVSASGSYNRQRTETKIESEITSGALVAGGVNKRTSRTTSLSVSQPLFKGGRTLAGISSARATVEAQRAILKSSEQQVLLSAATAYLDVLRDTAVVNLRQNNVQVLTRQLEATQDRFSVGEITRTDVAQAEARLSASKSSRILAEGNLNSSIANYKSVIGKAPENLSSPSLMAGLPGSADETINQAAQNNPSVIAAQFTAKAAEKNVDSIRGELLPSLSLDGQLSKSWDTISDSSLSESAGARLTFSLPLYQGGTRYTRLSQSKHTLTQRRLESDQAVLSAKQNATSSWEYFQSTSASIDAIKTQIKASEIALEGVQREAEVGSRTVLDVLDAEQELLDARVGLVGAERDQLVASLQVLAAIGQLTGENLRLGQFR